MSSLKCEKNIILANFLAACNFRSESRQGSTKRSLTSLGHGDHLRSVGLRSLNRCDTGLRFGDAGVEVLRTLRQSFTSKKLGLLNILDLLKERSEKRVRFGLSLGLFGLELVQPRLRVSDKLIRRPAFTGFVHVEHYIIIWNAIKT